VIKETMDALKRKGDRMVTAWSQSRNKNAIFTVL